MIHNLELLKAKLLNHSEVQTHHVKRKANSLANLLANHGIEAGQEITHALWSEN